MRFPCRQAIRNKNKIREAGLMSRFPDFILGASSQPR